MKFSSNRWTADNRLAAVLAMAAASKRPLSVTLQLSDSDPPKRINGVPMADCSPHLLSLQHASGTFVAPMASVIAVADLSHPLIS